MMQTVVAEELNIDSIEDLYTYDIRVNPLSSLDYAITTSSHFLRSLAKAYEAQFGTDTLIPYQIDTLNFHVYLDKETTLDVAFMRTNASRSARYTKPESVMKNFKRMQVSLTKTGTMQAYVLHGRFDWRSESYVPIKRDQRWLDKLNRKVRAFREQMTPLFARVYDAQVKLTKDKYASDFTAVI